MTEESYEPESSAPAFPASVKRVAYTAIGVGVAVWLGLAAARGCARATARDYEAVGRVVWAHEVEGEWKGSSKPHLSGHRGARRDGVGIQLDGRDEPIEYTRPRPSKLSDFAPGDRVQVRYSEGGVSLWRHFQVFDVTKLPAGAP